MATYLESVEAQRKKREGQTFAPYWQAAQRELAEAVAPTAPQPSFFKDIADIGRKILPTSRVASTPTEENLRVQEHFRPGEPQLPLGGSRERRLEQFQAGMLPTAAQAATQPPPPREAAPNIPTASQKEQTTIPQPGLESEARRTYSQPRPAETTGQKTSSQIATSTAVSGRLPAESSDPRRRYMEMARMSLEDREKLLNSLPVGQRPIQVIRGNQESWYSPGMSREFATIPEAMSGVQGRPTYQSEEDRAQAEASRSAISGRQSQRQAHEMALKKAEFAQEEKMAREYGVGVRGGKGGKGGTEGFEFKEVPKRDEMGNEYKTMMAINKERPGEHFVIGPDLAPMYAGHIEKQMTDNPSSAERWAQNLETLDSETRLATLSKLSQEKRDKLREIALSKKKETEKK